MTEAKLPAIGTPEREALIKQVAALAALQKNQSEISRELKVHVSSVRRILLLPECKDLMREIADEAVQNAKNIVRAQTERLTPKALRALEELLDSDSGKDRAEGIKIYMRAIGLDKEATGEGVGNLIVNLPGANPDAGKVIEVKSDEVYPTDKE